MPIRLECSCGRKLTLLDSLANKQIRCPDCQAVIRVPDPAAEKRRVLQQPVRKKPKARKEVPPPSRDWSEHYDNYAYLDDTYTGQTSGRHESRARAKRESAPFDVRRILRILFSWQLVLVTLLAVVSTILGIWGPSLDQLFPSTPSVPLADSALTAGSAMSPSTHEVSLDGNCFVSFPGAPTEDSKTFASPYGNGRVHVFRFKDELSGNQLVVFYANYDKQQFDRSGIAGETILNRAAEISLGTRGGNTIQHRALRQTADGLRLDLKFTFPGGSHKGSSYPAGTRDLRVFLKEHRTFTLMVDSSNPESSAATVQKEAFFDSIRFVGGSANIDDRP